MRLLLLFFLGIMTFAQAQNNIEVIVSGWGGEGAANQLEYSRDGKAIAFNRGRTVLLCDVRTGKVVRSFTSEFGEIGVLALSPTREYLAVAGRFSNSKSGSMVQIWNLITGKTETIQLHDKKRVTALAFSPDGKYLASGGTNNDIYLFTVNEQLEINQTGVFDSSKDGHKKDVKGLRFTPDGQTLLSFSNDNTIKIWDMAAVQLRKTLEIPSDIFSLDVGPQGRYAVGGGRDEQIRLWDLESGEMKTLSGHEKNITAVLISPDGKTIISAAKDQTIRFWNLQGEQLFVFDPIAKEYELRGGREHSNEIFANNIVLTISPDGRYLAYSMYFNFLGNISNTSDGDMPYVVNLLDIARKQVIRQLPDSDSAPLIKLFFDENGERLATFTKDRDFQILNLEHVTQELSFHIPDTTVRSVVLSPDWRYVLYQHGTEPIADRDKFMGRGVQELSAYELCLLPSGLTTGEGYSYKDRKIIKTFHSPLGASEGRFSPDGKFLALTEKNGGRSVLNIWELDGDQEPSLAQEIEIPDFTVPNDLPPIVPVDFSADGRHLAIGLLNKIQIFEIGKWDDLAGSLDLPEDRSDIAGINFIDDDRTLMVNLLHTKNSLGGRNCEFINITYPKSEDGEREKKKKKKGLGGLIRNLSEKVDMLEGDDDPFIKRGPLKLSSPFGNLIVLPDVVAIAPDRQFMAEVPNEYEIKFRPLRGLEMNMGGFLVAKEAEAGMFPEEKLTQRSVITSMAISPDARFLVIGSDNGSIDLVHLLSGQKIMTIAVAKDNYIFFAPDYYYATDREGGKLLFVRIDDDYYPFDVLDVKYNRPDLVWKALSDPETGIVQPSEETAYKFDAYYRAYQKRLEKMELREGDLTADAQNLPKVEIQNIDQLPIETTERNLSLKLKMTDAKVKLSALHISVNDVPIFGTAGLSLQDEAAMSLEKALTIPLSFGSNQIQISVVNTAGKRSYRETIPPIKLTGEKPASNLVLIAIGVSQYQNEEMNLRFAEKDASELVALFRKNAGNRKVEVFQLTNENATRENILALSQNLEATHIDDQVIIYYAGHGMYDADYNYILATHDIDFSDPAARGLSYDQLLGLLDGIPARNKLLLLDACHSGEIDKENIEQVEAVLEEEEDITFRSFGNKKVQEKQVGLENSFELMKSLFADLREGTGSAVIAAAGGAEYAMEGGGVENGVFTHVLLKGLGEKAADQNGDGEVQISELQAYLNREVSKMTHNQQRPTTRTRKFSNDWRVW